MAVLLQPGRSSSNATACLRTVDALRGSTTPNSLSKPRIRLMAAVRSSMKPWRTRCTLNLRLLLEGLDRHKAHVGALHSLADRRRVSGVVLAPLASQAIGAHELWRDQANRMTVSHELAGPVVRAGACLHPDHARRKRGD